MSTSTPIYDSVCEDLKIFPRAISRRDHAQFMRDHSQSAWLEMTLDPSRPALPDRRKRRGLLSAGQKTKRPVWR